MADGVAITAGAGTTVLTDDCGAPGHAQVVKLAISTDGSATLIPAEATNGLDVDVTRVIPGTDATHLGKGEDAAHASGDVGVMALAVRKDTPANLSGTDGDYEPLQVSGGYLHVKPGATENQLGFVGAPGDLIDVTLTLDTSAYADGDVLADTQTVTNAVRVSGGRAILQSIQVLDEDDQGQGLDLVFLSANNSLGTENAAPSITDANARDILGYVRITSGEYIDLGGCRIATKTGIGLVLEAAGSTSLYLGAISRGTGTYTASGIRLRLGLLWD